MSPCRARYVSFFFLSSSKYEKKTADDIATVREILSELLRVENKHDQLDLDKLCQENELNSESELKAVALLKSIWPRLRVEKETELVVHCKTEPWNCYMPQPDFTIHDLEWSKPKEMEDIFTDFCPDEDWSVDELQERYGPLEDDGEDGDKEGTYSLASVTIEVYVLSLQPEESDDESESDEEQA